VICPTVAGKLFHTRGPATAKLLSPRVVRVRGTASVLLEDERGFVADFTSLQSVEKKSG